MRTRKETHIESQEHYNSMVEHPPDPHAYDWLKRPAGVRGLIRQQAGRAEKYKMESVADGQEHT